MFQTSQSNTQTADQVKTKAKTQGKAFCKVCFDAKKPESIYTSHFVKSTPGPDGKIICPTLLNQACRNCGQPGHTSSYCSKASDCYKAKQSHVLSTNTNGSISAEAELKLMTATFKSKNHFPSLHSNAEPEETQQTETQQPCHVYNPKSNPFGTLSNPNPKQKSFQKHSQQSTTQPTTQSTTQPKPMTMAERLKNPAPAPGPAPTPTPAPVKPKFADLPPKSQFWWQDEDD